MMPPVLRLLGPWAGILIRGQPMDAKRTVSGGIEKCLDSGISGFVRRACQAAESRWAACRKQKSVQ